MPPATNLEPCPFCGGEAEQPFVGDAVECKDKNCRGYSVSVTNWNRRTLTSENTRLREALEAVASGEAFREQRFAEDNDAEYFLRAQRNVQKQARTALATTESNNG